MNQVLSIVVNKNKQFADASLIGLSFTFTGDFPRMVAANTIQAMCYEQCEALGNNRLMPSDPQFITPDFVINESRSLLRELAAPLSLFKTAINTAKNKTTIDIIILVENIVNQEETLTNITEQLNQLLVTKHCLHWSQIDLNAYSLIEKVITSPVIQSCIAEGATDLTLTDVDWNIYDIHDCILDELSESLTKEELAQLDNQEDSLLYAPLVAFFNNTQHMLADAHNKALKNAS